MFAVKVEGINFWEETPNCGFQISGDYKEVSTIGGEGGFVVSASWMNAEKSQTVLNEIRSITGEYLQTMKANLFTWRSIFTAAESKSSVELSGAHYNGLGMRFQRSMDKNGKFVSAADKSGDIFRGEERLITDRWCAYYSQVGDKQVTVVMFDSPKNPSSPATWFTMKEPFAYLSATMRLHEDPLTLESGETLMLTYGIALWDGHVDKKMIESVYEYWNKKVNQNQ
jgi:hypothetical protein